MAQLKDVMTENMRNLLERDQKLDGMLEKTSKMTDLSVTIKKQVKILSYSTSLKLALLQLLI